jgi:hypothetical protein
MVLHKGFPCFPIPVSIYNFKDELHQLNIDLVKDTFKEKELDPEGLCNSNYGGWHSKDVLSKPSFNTLAGKIEECLDDYCDKNGFEGGLKCTLVWTNISKENEMIMAHHHGKSVMAGVYYPVQQVHKNKCQFNYTDNVSLQAGAFDGSMGGCLVIQDPSYGMKTKINKKATISPFTVDHYHYYPIAGTLVLLPPYLVHSVLPFTGKDTQRISISFSCQYNS